ncbi:helix-turn-helix protein [Shimia isoporae]|uniref:Helix-turn-helix protein n=1 Tax=Shimia isoporae TaxID=647720 RepID=A0A4R1N7U1_9RHOB|nr:helix-turn-helix domain-containing protein [Shimia isoporae]TCK99358.1 helix-turn-helix protein [Shimia isoporae]
MPPKEKRGRQNAWRPNKEDRLRIVQQAAAGMGIRMIAREHGVDKNTLMKHCQDELQEGRDLNKGILKSRVFKLAQQDNHLHVALSATKFALGAFHGVSEEGGSPEDDLNEAEEHQRAELDSLDEKLETYLQVENKAKPRSKAKRIPPPANDLPAE